MSFLLTLFSPEKKNESITEQESHPTDQEYGSSSIPRKETPFLNIDGNCTQETEEIISEVSSEESEESDEDTISDDKSNLTSESDAEKRNSEYSEESDNSEEQNSEKESESESETSHSDSGSKNLDSPEPVQSTSKRAPMTRKRSAKNKDDIVKVAKSAKIAKLSLASRRLGRKTTKNQSYKESESEIFDSEEEEEEEEEEKAGLSKRKTKLKHKITSKIHQKKITSQIHQKKTTSKKHQKKIISPKHPQFSKKTRRLLNKESESEDSQKSSVPSDVEPESDTKDQDESENVSSENESVKSSQSIKMKKHKRIAITSDDENETVKKRTRSAVKPDWAETDEKTQRGKTLRAIEDFKLKRNKSFGEQVGRKRIETPEPGKKGKFKKLSSNKIF